MAIRQSLGVDRKGGFVVKSTKTGRERLVPLCAPALESLRKVRAAQAADKLAAGPAYDARGFVFADALGLPIHPDLESKAFAATARAAKLKGVTLHSLRHSTATWALGKGGDIRTVASLLGHSAPSTTLNVYSHVIAGRSARVSDGLGETLRIAQARRAAGEKSGS